MKARNLNKTDELIVTKRVPCPQCGGEGYLDIGRPGEEPSCPRCLAKGHLSYDYPLEQAIVDLLGAGRVKITLET